MEQSEGNLCEWSHMYFQTHFEAHPVVKVDAKVSGEFHSVHALVSLVMTHVEEERKEEQLKAFLAVASNPRLFDGAPMLLRDDQPEHPFPGESGLLDYGRPSDPYLHEMAAERLCCDLLEHG